jgi:hypothetical protein
MQELYAAEPTAFTPSLTSQDAEAATTNTSSPYSQYMQMMLGMVAQATCENQSSPNPYALQLHQLSLMGFNDTQRNREALTANNGDLNAALSSILQQQLN